MFAWRPSLVVHLSREFGNLISVGGAKDTTYGICNASAKAGINTYLFLPFPYAQDEITKLNAIGTPLEVTLPMNLGRKGRWTEQAWVHRYGLPNQDNLTLCLVKSDRFSFLFDQGDRIPRDQPYTYSQSVAEQLGEPDLSGKGYTDLFEMNVLLVKATLRAIELFDLAPDLIHCHDTQLGFLPLITQCTTEGFASRLAYVPTLTTVHNLTNYYRGEIEYSELVPSVLGVPEHIVEKLLNGKKFEPLLCAGLFGTALNTVSENYAYELQHTGTDWKFEWLGHRLLGYGIHVEGITNGVDLQEFDPSDPERMNIPAAYDPRKGQFEGKKLCRELLLHELGVESYSNSTAILGSVGRLDFHKGSDILVTDLEILFEQDSDVILAGTGGGYRTQIDVLRRLQARFPERVYYNFTYAFGLGNRIYAGSDFVVIPSRHEACGLTDFIAQLFGSLPIVHSVGGLVKVIDGETGFSYRGDVVELLKKVHEAIAIYRTNRPRIEQMQRQAVQVIADRYTWQYVFEEKYLPLYKRAIEKPHSHLP